MYSTVTDKMCRLTLANNGQIVEEGCGVVLTREQQSKVAYCAFVKCGSACACARSQQCVSNHKEHARMHVQVAAKRAELQGDPNAKTTSKGTGRVADHKSLDMYGAFGSGGGEGWGGGGGTRGDDYDFM
jgi:hypothetical protein